MIELITLLNLVGRPDEALDLLAGRKFHPWEGGEGKTTGQYVLGLVEKARRFIEEAEYDKAIDCLERPRVYPPDLGEGKLYGAQENNIDYYLGCALERLGDGGRARRAFEQATIGPGEPASAMYYNDQPPDMIYYRGLAHRKLRHTARGGADIRQVGGLRQAASAGRGPDGLLRRLAPRFSGLRR